MRAWIRELELLMSTNSSTTRAVESLFYDFRPATSINDDEIKVTIDHEFGYFKMDYGDGKGGRVGCWFSTIYLIR